ncbi:MAG: phosphotransferase [Mycobacterium sp.]|nr:phosphotransferase [Mycobacterium sp.]
MDVARIVAEITGSRPTWFEPLTGGQESTARHCRFADRDDLVVLIDPGWRTRAELEWAHTVCRQASQSVPEVVAPISFGGQTTFDLVGGRQAEFFPFVAGNALDPTVPALRRDAARVLAQIHHSLLDWSGGPRPPHGPDIPLYKRLDEDALQAVWDPVEIQDPELDEWWESARCKEYARCPTQGDFWAANILTSEDRVVGIIDWHDANIVPCISELAWAASTCTGDPAELGRDFYAFIDTYRESGGPVADAEVADVVFFLRQRRRDSIRRTLAIGCPIDYPYAQNQIRTFRDTKAS